MKLGSSRQRERKRKQRRFFFALLKWGFLLGLILAAGIYAWRTASNVARRDVIDLTVKTEQLESEVTRLRTQVTEGKSREAVLEQQIPDDQQRALMEIVRRKADEGVSYQRLADIVAAATPSQDCDNDPMSRRFQVQTAIPGNESTAASFGDNVLTVRATGEPSIDAVGRPEAWFDPGKPVRVNFTHVSGATTTAKGLLPIQHVMAVGDDQYRFQLSAGPRSFINATMDRCDYP